MSQTGRNADGRASAMLLLDGTDPNTPDLERGSSEPSWTPDLATTGAASPRSRRSGSDTPGEPTEISPSPDSLSSGSIVREKAGAPADVLRQQASLSLRQTILGAPVHIYRSTGLLLRRARRRPWVSLALILVTLFLLSQDSPIMEMSSTLMQSPREAAATVSAAMRVGRFHLLIPASSSNYHLCRLLFSAMVNRYPVPVLINWNVPETDDFYDMHMRKITQILSYLNAFTPEHDNDLVLMVDGYDVWFQLPAETLVRRYFEATKQLDDRLRKRLGPEIVAQRDFRHTILFGPDKLCWPSEDIGKALRMVCWVAPDSPLPKNAYGPTDDDDFLKASKDPFHARPRWLNSGTIIGPVGDMRRLFAATSKRASENSNIKSDQYHFADIWAEQEYIRRLYDPEASPPPDNVSLPRPETLGGGTEQTEFHVGLDYDSAMFQPVGYTDAFLSWRTYDPSAARRGRLRWQQTHHGPTATDDATLAELDHSSGLSLFMSNALSVPDNRSLAKDIWQAHPPLTVLEDLVSSKVAELEAMEKRQDVKTKLSDKYKDVRLKGWQDLPLMTNLVTRRVPAVVHFTFAKHYDWKWWDRMWFAPFAKDLYQAFIEEDVDADTETDIVDIAAKASPGDSRYLLRHKNDILINGTRWLRARDGPPASLLAGGSQTTTPQHRRNGAWSDQGIWVPWHEMCLMHEAMIFNADTGRFDPLMASQRAEANDTTGPQSTTTSSAKPTASPEESATKVNIAIKDYFGLLSATKQPADDEAALNKQIKNSSLGFERVFVLGLPDRGDRHDSISLAAGATEFDIEFIDGVNATDLNDASLPESAGQPNDGKRNAQIGAWRAHVNIARKIVTERIATAMIFEDDSDWDVTLKDRLVDFAYGSRHFAKQRGPNEDVDDVFNGETNDEDENHTSVYRPVLESPTLDSPSPYGEDWDMLWLGHCAIEQRNESVADRQRFLIANDGSTVTPEDAVNFDIVPNMSMHPRLTRAVLRASRGACLHGYALSYRGAQRILAAHSSLADFTPVDLSYGDMCEDDAKGKQEFKCLGIFPQIIDTHKPIGSKDDDSNMGKYDIKNARKTGFTFNVRFSARLNAERLKLGQVPLSQWPGERDPPPQMPSRPGVAPVGDSAQVVEYQLADMSTEPNLNIKPDDVRARICITDYLDRQKEDTRKKLDDERYRLKQQRKQKKKPGTFA